MSDTCEVTCKYDVMDHLFSSDDPADDREKIFEWSYDDRLLYINYPDSTTSSMKYEHNELRTYRKDKAGYVTNYYWSTLGCHRF